MIDAGPRSLTISGKNEESFICGVLQAKKVSGLLFDFGNRSSAIDHISSH